MFKRKLLLVFSSLLISVLAVLCLCNVFIGNPLEFPDLFDRHPLITTTPAVDDTFHRIAFDYECVGNDSESNRQILHYCIRGPKIFFLETSESDKLSVRQGCAVESTARHNPSMSVAVLMTPSTNIKFTDDIVKALTSIPNVALQQINLDVFLRGTPTWGWLKAGKWKRSQWKVSHMSDAIRFMVVWKYGGMYLDLDIVTLRSLENLTNSVVTEEWENIAAGILFFEKSHDLMKRCMEDFASNYKPYDFAINGPGLITRNLKQFCGVKSVKVVSTSNCSVRVLAPAAAFPIGWPSWRDYLKPIQLNTSIASHFSSSYMIHVWNTHSKNGKLNIGENSLYERAMKENCPLVYQHALKFASV